MRAAGMSTNRPASMSSRAALDGNRYCTITRRHESFPMGRLMTGRESAFRPLAPPKNLTVKLVDLLAAEITSGKLAPGARLPTEQEMMASFGVSRTVIREAVSALRSEGLVLTRQGVGAFVASDVKGRPFRIDPDGLKSLQEILRVMELRMGVEIFAAGLAAERRK